MGEKAERLWMRYLSITVFLIHLQVEESILLPPVGTAHLDDYTDESELEDIEKSIHVNSENCDTMHFMPFSADSSTSTSVSMSPMELTSTSDTASLDNVPPTSPITQRMELSSLTFPLELEEPVIITSQQEAMSSTMHSPEQDTHFVSHSPGQGPALSTPPDLLCPSIQVSPPQELLLQHTTPSHQSLQERAGIQSNMMPSGWVGFKIVGDNIDKTVRPRHQTLENRTQSLHYFHSYAVKDRIDIGDLSDTKPALDLTTLPFTTFLPSEKDLEQLLYCTCSTNSSKVYPSILSFGKGHIPHRYLKEMSIKSDVVSQVYIVATHCLHVHVQNNLRFHWVLF